MPDNKGPSPFQRRYPPEMRERAVRLVAETIAEAGGERHGAVTQVARQLGIGTESLRSNDSGRMTQRIPTATLSLSIGEPPLGEHSYEFMEAAASPAGDRALSDAAKIIALTAVDLMAVGTG